MGNPFQPNTVTNRWLKDSLVSLLIYKTSLSNKSIPFITTVRSSAVYIIHIACHTKKQREPASIERVKTIVCKKQ